MRDMSQPMLEYHDGLPPQHGSRSMSLAGLLALLVVCACGRTEHDVTAIPDGAPQAGGGSQAGGTSQAGAASDTASSGTGPIDLTGQPLELVACPERSSSFTIELPCLVGQDVAGTSGQPEHNLVECKLLGTLEADAVYFMLPLAQVPKLLNVPTRLPLLPTVAAPVRLDATIGGEHLIATLAGLITFTQIDVDSRTFVATLQQGQLEWGGDPMGDFNCTTMDGSVWAVAGDLK